MQAVKKARALRREETKPEALFWDVVRNRGFMNLKFRRQVPINKYFADFVCEAEKLIIELDGDSHVGNEAYDETRTQILEAHGYRVMRFDNSDIYENIDGVFAEIALSVGQA